MYNKNRKNRNQNLNIMIQLFSEHKLIKKLYRDIEIFIPVYLNTLFIKTFSNKFFVLCFEWDIAYMFILRDVDLNNIELINDDYFGEVLLKMVIINCWASVTYFLTKDFLIFPIMIKIWSIILLTVLQFWKKHGVFWNKMSSVHSY